MNKEWFECKIKYEKMMENGSIKKVTEPYLVDAVSFTEAEKRIVEEIVPFMSGEFLVTDIKRANISELFETNDEKADRWFKAKLTFITLDEKSGAEKKTSQFVLIKASDLRDAVKRLDEGMKDSMMDYVISSISETLIMDVFHYKTIEECTKSDLETIESLPDGKSKLVIKGKKVEIDKTGRFAKVTFVDNFTGKYQPENDEG